MTLSPSVSQLIYSEVNVKPSAGLAPRASYDAALYVDQAGAPKGVLVITICLQYRFEDGVSEQDATKGQKLTWTDDEKQKFADGFRSICYAVWNNRFRITTTSTVTNVTDIGVEIDIQNVVDKFTINNHWKATVKKKDIFQRSSVNDWSGGADFASVDLNAFMKYTPPSAPAPSAPQRTSPHEFGHMLGHRDEYVNPDGSIPGTSAWTSDSDSIMYAGEKVRERHYAMFAAWISDQFSTVAKLSGGTIAFKVSGAWDLSNSNL
jgi:hypothetical protein